MVKKRLRAISEINRSNVRLEMNSAALILMVTVKMTPLPLSSKGAYFLLAKTTILLVQSSSEPCKQELILGTYGYIAYYASQTLSLTEYISFALE